MEAEELFFTLFHFHGNDANIYLPAFVSCCLSLRISTIALSLSLFLRQNSSEHPEYSHAPTAFSSTIKSPSNRNSP